MTFKGTTVRSAEDISKDLEGIGANSNAFTSKYLTCFYATCMTEKSEKCFEILSDMFFNSTFDQNEIDKERKVIFEEIDMYEDDPSSIAHDDFIRIFYNGTKVEKTVIGTKESLQGINRKEIVEYRNKYYTPKYTVVSVTGGITEKVLDEYIEKYFLTNFDKAEDEPFTYLTDEVKYLSKKQFSFLERNFAQTHIVMGFPLRNLYSKDRVAYNLLSFVVGGGMSSRLFQKIREDLGLVYNIHCFPDLYDIGGCMVITLATNSEQQETAIKAIKEELDKIIKDGITNEELERAKVFIKTLLVTSSEKTINITRQNANDVLIHNKLRPIELKLSEIQETTLEQVNNIIPEIFDYSMLCGTIVSDKPNKDAFNCFN